ncbi:hypothetical protein [Corynebacterium sp. HS2168-gen11]|uniref:hypothetical protein n=1 Tax=Corynebacterium sp. HS2168-gen11 TaxID=2974027 RepID=UPI00216B665D|nr:hypothetical protein [Corynebacterium sp. HS2168-gen11]MCS4535787.1 hypothetical protein [Corynebacterium sp. HS2168-gen11]
MNKKYRIPVLMLTTALAFSGAAVVSPIAPITGFLAVSSAATAAEIPADKLLLGAPDDAQQWAGQYQSLSRIERVRHYYALAGAAGVNAIDASSYPYGWAGRSLAEQAQYLAQARVAVTLLQASNYPNARAIDVEQVGVTPEASAAAKELFAAATATLQERATAEQDSAVRSKLNDFKDYIWYANSGINAAIAGTKPYDSSPFAVLNYGITNETYLNKNRGESGVTDEDLNNVVITNVEFSRDAVADKVAEAAQQAATNSTETKAKLAEAFGNVNQKDAAPAGPTPEELNAAYNEAYAAISSAEDIVTNYEGRADSADLQELAKIREAAANLTNQIRELKEAGNLAELQAKKAEAEALKTRAEAIKTKIDNKPDVAPVIERLDAVLAKQQEALKIAETKDPAAAAELKKKLLTLTDRVAAVKATLQRITTNQQLSVIVPNVATIESEVADWKAKVEALADKTEETTTSQTSTPSEPSKTSEPSKPSEPSKTSTPVKPTEPSKPVYPVEDARTFRIATVIVLLFSLLSQLLGFAYLFKHVPPMLRR